MSKMPRNIWVSPNSDENVFCNYVADDKSGLFTKVNEEYIRKADVIKDLKSMLVKISRISKNFHTDAVTWNAAIAMAIDKVKKGNNKDE